MTELELGDELGSRRVIWDHPAWVTWLALAFGLVEASLSEYWIHRWMHLGGPARRRHALHHKQGTGQGWALEFRDYALPAVPFCAASFLLSVPIGLGFSVGVTLYWAFAAYAHQLQHERPELVFWMRRPVHHLHHHHHMTRHNFGIGVDVWDRLFGTYRAEPFARDLAAPWPERLRIKWF